MSNAESGFWSSPGRSDRDPFTGMIVAMRDACMASAAALERLNGTSVTTGNPGTATPGGALAGAAGAMTANHLRRHSGSSSDLSGGATEDSPEHSLVTDLVLPMGHAMAITASRSASYWLGLAQILATHQTKSVRAIGASAVEGSAAESQRIAVAEDLRTLLREVGDLAVREAGILQNDLGNLSQRLAQSVQQPDPSTPYRRRWRTKV